LKNKKNFAVNVLLTVIVRNIPRVPTKQQNSVDVSTISDNSMISNPTKCKELIFYKGSDKEVF
jgi:hypothetical protein